jgi:A/G-specific adenine glycosylase
LKGLLWSLAEALVPVEQPGSFNQALMELGSQVCTPRSPNCRACPISTFCVACQEGRVEELPSPSPRPSFRRRTDVAAWVASDAGWLLVQRPEDELWAGLWELPRCTLSDGEKPEEGARRALREVVGLEGEVDECCAILRHGVTRWAVTLQVYRVVRWHGEPQPLACAACRWVPPEELHALPLSSPQRKLVRKLLQAETEGS